MSPAERKGRTQSVERGLEGLQEELNIKHNIYRDCIRFSANSLYKWFKLLGKTKYKHIPTKFLEFSSHSLQELLNGLLLTDGHSSKAGYCSYYTTSEILKEQLYELTLKCNRYCNVNRILIDRISSIDGRIITPTAPCFCINIGLRKIISIQSTKNIKETDYSGKVYCLEVPYHRMYVRRTGCPVWCGNTGTVMKTARDLGRNSVGIEISKEYIEHAKQNIGWGENPDEMEYLEI
jgi:hypothetical protein